MKVKFKKPHQWSIGIVATMIVMASMTLSLLVTLLFTWHAEIQNNQETIKNNLYKTARVVANNPIVKQNVLKHQQSKQIQSYVKSINKVSNVQFIVVLDDHYIRYSHPKPSEVGKRFLSVADAKKSIKGQPHLSTTAGVMGPEYRYFYPIYHQRKVIGLVCLGYYQKNLRQETMRLTIPLFIGALVGLVIGAIGAFILERYLRKVLLGMEPNEIAAEVVKHDVVINSIVEGIIAIDEQDCIIEMNRPAQALFQDQLQRDSPIPADFKHKFFDIIHYELGVEHEVWYGSRQLVVSTMPLNLKNNRYGMVTLIRDISEVASLISQLSGNERYIESLRAQTHQFMNQLHVINGLLEIDDGPAAQEFIAKITQVHDLEIGQITKLIKLPSLAGLILGKIKQASEQQITLTLTDQSLVPEKEYATKYEVDLLRVISNLIDNAIDAVLETSEKNINLLIKVDEKSDNAQIVIEDTGKGIADTELIFTTGYSTKGDKRGFGMQIIAAAVKELNGNIEVTSTVGEGTIIEVWLGGLVNESNDN